MLFTGNAAIVLRSRLKVRVLKKNWEKKAQMDEQGIILTNGDSENNHKAMQYQVSRQAVSAAVSNPQSLNDDYIIH